MIGKEVREEKLAERTKALREVGNELMIENRCKRSGTALSEGDFFPLERMTNFPLPPDFKEHYLSFNGGVPERPCWCTEEFEPHTIATFIPIKAASHGEDAIEEVLAKLRAANVLPNGLMPFARDWGGNYFCLMSDGRVAFFATDSWRERLSVEENQSRATRLLAESFAGFVDRLRAEAECC